MIWVQSGALKTTQNKPKNESQKKRIHRQSTNNITAHTSWITDMTQVLSRWCILYYHMDYSNLI